MVVFYTVTCKMGSDYFKDGSRFGDEIGVVRYGATVYGHPVITSVKRYPFVSGDLE
jgi:hypothetical protein